MTEREAADWPIVIGPDDWRHWDERSEPDGLGALATLLGLRHEHRIRRHRATGSLIARPAPDPVLIVGVGGPVASGKSTIAAQLADRLASPRHELGVAVVSTDGFLRPNAELEEAGLTMRKGFPESYDLAALRRFVDAVRSGEQSLTVPVYDHQRYDVAAEPALLDRPDVLVLEGVNALQAAPDGGVGPAALIDTGLYIDVPEATVIGWFVERFLTLTREAEQDPTSFYGLWAGLPDPEVERAARDVWAGVNGVNLREHIAPSRRFADIEVVKDPTHDVAALRLRSL